jgi:hypothetical protein
MAKGGKKVPPSGPFLASCDVSIASGGPASLVSIFISAVWPTFDIYIPFMDSASTGSQIAVVSVPTDVFSAKSGIFEVLQRFLGIRASQGSLMAVACLSRGSPVCTPAFIGDWPRPTW